MKKQHKKNQNNEDLVINIKVDNKEQIISKYSYDETDKLNKDLSEFIIDKTKRTPINSNIKLNFYSKTNIEKTEVERTIRNHFTDELLDAKDDLKKSNIIALIMLLFGVITFAILFASYNLFSNIYFEMVMEIAAWVFIWESVDVIFLQRPKIRRTCLQYQKICLAEVEIIVDKNNY